MHVPVFSNARRKVGRQRVFVERVAKGSDEVVHHLDQAVARKAAAAAGIGTAVPMVEVAAKHRAVGASDRWIETR